MVLARNLPYHNLLQRTEEAGVFRLGADRDAQAVLEAGRTREVAHEHARIEEALPDLAAIDFRIEAEEHVICLGIERRDAGQCVQLVDDAAHLVVIKALPRVAVKLNAQARLDLDTADEVYRNDPYDYSLTQFPVLCSSDFFDVVITDRTGLDFCSYSNIIFDPEIIISPDTVLALRDHEAKAKDSAGAEYFYAYDITDTKFAKSLNFGTRLYLCFPGRADGNKENAERFLRYLYGLENKTE